MAESGRPEGDEGPDGRECALAASGAEDSEAHAVADPVEDRTGAEGAQALLGCPACGSARIAHVLGDNGGESFVCTSCGHSWS